MAFRLPTLRTRRDDVSRWHFSQTNLCEVREATARADAERVDYVWREEDWALRLPREAYEESKEQEKEE